MNEEQKEGVIASRFSLPTGVVPSVVLIRSPRTILQILRQKLRRNFRVVFVNFRHFRKLEHAFSIIQQQDQKRTKAINHTRAR